MHTIDARLMQDMDDGRTLIKYSSLGSGTKSIKKLEASSTEKIEPESKFN
jgi:hypothetical protein